MRKILLVSSSRVHGTGYLDHCEEEMRRLLDGVQRVLFVPFAQVDVDGYEKLAAERFAALGLELASVHRAADPAAAVADGEAVFIGGGNTFLLLTRMIEHGLMAPLARRVAEGMPYMGTSAGSNVAGVSIRTTNDMPIIYPPTFDALGLVPFNLNPHYLDPNPDSQHMGETRETRIREFHELNDTLVVGIREGSMVRVEGDRAELVGAPGGKLFRRGQPPEERAAGDISEVLG